MVKIFYSSIQANMFTDYMVTTTDSGWSNNDVGLEWLQRLFEPHTTTDLPRLLLMDGHGSHLSRGFFQHGIDKKIFLVCLPPHTSHLLQPLDVGVFAPESHWISQELNKPSLLGATSISPARMLELLAAARPRALTHRNITRAWKKTGMVPFRPAVVLEQLPGARPITPPQLSTDSRVHTPRTIRDVDSALDRMVDEHEFTPRAARSLAIMARGTKRLAAELDLLTAENNNLREAVDRQVRRRKKMVGETGLVATMREARHRVREIDTRDTARDKASRLAQVRKERLAALIERGIMPKGRVRPPKACLVVLKAYELNSQFFLAPDYATDSTSDM